MLMHRNSLCDNAMLLIVNLIIHIYRREDIDSFESLCVTATFSYYYVEMRQSDVL